MNAYKAQVRGGRLVLDVPTDLPEGTEVELVTAEADLEPALDLEQRTRLYESIEQGEADIARGDWVDGFALLDRIKAQHEAQGR